MPLKVGDVLENRYRIEELLGKGGMAAVYRAWHLPLKISVAVKVNLLQSETSQRQFSREASILASLRHPNLPHVNDFFSIQAQGQCLVVEYIEGQDLEQILASQGTLPVARVLDWIGHVLDALEYLHSKNVIHRDVKPSNIKITPEGQVVLVDFGLAQDYDSAGPPTVTPGYAPLEQYGHGPADARTDVYSVGATLYALLTRQVPPDVSRLAIRTSRLVAPSELSPELTPDLEAAILRAMQAAPDDRFQTVATFREALREALEAGSSPADDGAVPVLPPEPSEKQSPFVRSPPGPELQGTVPADELRARRQAVPKPDPVPAVGVIVPPNARRVVELACWGRDPIDQIALSPDGSILAVAAGARIDLYDVGTQQEVRRIRTGGRMASLAFSPDGGALAAAFRGLVQLWRVNDGQEIAAVRDLSASVESAVFAPSGGTLALGVRDHTVRIWSIQERHLMAELTGHAGVVTSLAFSPDGLTLASGSYDGSARLWRVRDGALQATLQGHSGWVLALAFSPDGAFLATGSRDRTVRLWRVADGEGLFTLEDHGAVVRSLAFSPDGALLASGAWDGVVRLWRVHDGERRAVLTGHEAVVQGLAFLPDGTRLVSGSRDGTVRLWGVSPG